MATVASMWVKVGADIKDLKKNLSEGERAAQRFADRMGSVGRKLSVAATLPILAMGAASLKAAGDFESGLNRVRAVSGATAAEFEALKKQAADLGATTQYTAGQAADAMGFLGMAGFKATEILGAMPGTLQLAAAAQIDLARSADIVTNILTGYGLAVEELGRANDVLVRTFTRTNVDLSMLGESFKYVGPVAKSAGVAFEETAAAIGLMGNAGIQGSMAGTALRGAITRLLKPTAEVSRTLQRLGVSATDSQGRLRSLVDIVQQLEESGATTGDMMAIFGQRAGPAMAALVDQGSDALRSLVRELEASGGTAQRIAETQMKGLRGAWLELKSAAEALALAITGTGLLEGATGLAKRLASMIRAVAGLPRPVLQLVAALAALAAVIAPLLVVGGKLVTLFLQLKMLAAAVGVGISAIAAPVAAVVAGLAALGGVLYIWGRKRAAAAEARQEVERLKESLEGMTAPAILQRVGELRKALHGRRSLQAIQGDIDTLKGRGLPDWHHGLKRLYAERDAVLELTAALRAAEGAYVRAAKAASDAVGGAKVSAAAARSLETTADNYARLIDIRDRALETLADLRIEEALAPGEEALAEIAAQIAAVEDRLRRVTEEMHRFDRAAMAAASRISVPLSGVGMSIERSVQAQLRRPGQLQPIRAATEVERAQATLERWLSDPRVTVDALSDTAEFRQVAAILRRDRERRAEIEAAVSRKQPGAFELLKEGDVFGALKAAFVPLLKVAVPLAVAFEVVRGVLDALGEPLKALLLPFRMLGETIGRALLPVIRALWPAVKWLTIALSYSAQALFTVAGWLFKAIGEVITGLGKVVKWLTFGIVKQLEQAGKGMVRMGGEMLGAAGEMGELRRDLKNMSFEDALDRVTDAAHRAADALLNVPSGFKVAWARFQATAPEATVSMPGSPPTSTPAGHTTVQNHVPVTIHVHATERTDVPALVQEIKREFSREAQRGGVTGLELVFGAA